MDINNDELKRELRDLDKEHREAMPKWRESLFRLFEDKETPTEAKADALLGGFNRRRFMKLTGLAVVGVTVLAACGATTRRTASPAAAPPRRRRPPPPRPAATRPTRPSPGRPPHWRSSPWRSTTRRS